MNPEKLLTRIALNVAIGQQITQLLQLPVNSRQGTIKTMRGNKTIEGLGDALLKIVDAEIDRLMPRKIAIVLKGGYIDTIASTVDNVTIYSMDMDNNKEQEEDVSEVSAEAFETFVAPLRKQIEENGPL